MKNGCKNKHFTSASKAKTAPSPPQAPGTQTKHTADRVQPKETAMKYILRIFKKIITLMVIFIFSSCCNEQDENSGIIQCDLNIDGFYISTYDCLKLPDTACIRNEAEFKNIFSITGTNSDCGEIKLPIIDFNEYSVLINHKFGGGKHYYHRTVTVDSINKTITYSIYVGSCPVFVDYETDSYNPVLVPKIGNDYKIEYK